MNKFLTACILIIFSNFVFASEKIDLEELLRADLLFPPIQVQKAENGGKLIEISSEMRSYLNGISRRRPPTERFNAVISDLKKNNFKLQYDLNRTATASEAFSEQRGNCISGAAMIVSIARELGLKAYFNKAENPANKVPTKSEDGINYMQNVLHINAVVEVPVGRLTRRFIVESDLRIYPGKNLSKLDDSEATALYLNNLAMESMRRNDLSTAYNYARQATRLTPDASYLWVNLGTIYRRAGALPLAEKSLKNALSLNEEDKAAQENLKILNKEIKGNQNYAQKSDNLTDKET